MTKKFLINNICLLNFIIIFITILQIGSVVIADVNDGLVAYYPFNGNAHDESGNNNDGELLNGVSLTTDRFGNDNFAYSFDGIDDFIKAKADNLPVRERTVALWWHVETFEDSRAIIPIGYGGNGCETSFFIGIDKQRLGVAEHCNGSNLHYDDFLPEDTLGIWYFYAITTSDEDGTKIFVNGNKVVEDKNIVFGDTYVNGKKLFIGVASSTNGTDPHEDHNITYFNGKIDDIRIYDRELSETEVLELYNEPNPNPINIDDGLVAYYPFNGNALDHSGYGNDGTAYDAELTTDRFGKENSAYSFNGVNSWIRVNDSDSLDISDNLTIYVWVYGNSYKSINSIIHKINAYGIHYNSGEKENGEVNFLITPSYPTDWEIFDSDITPENNKWYNFTASYSLSEKVVKFYVNGVVQKTFSYGKPINKSSDILFIGGWDSRQQYFNGKIDDIRIYNRSLSEIEVKKLYDLEKPSIPIGKCPHLDWKQFQGNEYALTEHGSWYEAQIEANRCGGNLVTINDDEENSWISHQFSNTYTRSNTGDEYNAIAWIGYFFNSQTENSEWVNGEPVLYVNKHENFPQIFNFTYMHLNPHPFSPNWGTNPIHNSNYDYNPKGIIERKFTGCISQEMYCQAIKTERQKWDVNNDNQIGLEEAIHALQVTSGLSNSQSGHTISEVCNNFDDDCDGEIDEGVKTIYYRDSDNDSYGDLNNPIYSCKKPLGYVSNSDDCNDLDKNVHPGATETCNDEDDNCNNETDEGLPIVTYCQDLDGDNYGNPDKKQQACKQPSGYVDNCDDCDDSNKNIHPDATETCNDEDDNCNNETDEGLSIITYCQDLDGDNYGNPNIKQQACKQPSGYVDNCDDCDDSDKNVNPGANEICNGKDDNCDGKLKEVDIVRYWGENYDNFTTSGEVSVESKYTLLANLGKALCEPDGDKTIPIYSCEIHYTIDALYNPFNNPEIHPQFENGKTERYLRRDCSIGVGPDYKTLNNGEPVFYLYKEPGPGRKFIKPCYYPFHADTSETDIERCQEDYGYTTEHYDGCKDLGHSDFVCTFDDITEDITNSNNTYFLGYTSSE